jgi:hypothetical protein
MEYSCFIRGGDDASATAAKLAEGLQRAPGSTPETKELQKKRRIPCGVCRSMA